MKKMLIVDDAEGEWQALYVDGKKVVENHSLTIWDIINYIDVELDSYTYPELEEPDHQPNRFPSIWDEGQSTNDLTSD